MDTDGAGAELPVIPDTDGRGVELLHTGPHGSQENTSTHGM